MSMVRMVGPVPSYGEVADIEGFPRGDVTSASRGAITWDDRDEYVVSFRKPAVPHVVRDSRPDATWTDEFGRTAHLGTYDASDLEARWVAPVVPAPIVQVVACDGSVAVGYSELDDHTVVATGAAVWQPRALLAAEALPGNGDPACIDIDGDGHREPAIIGR